MEFFSALVPRLVEGARALTLLEIFGVLFNLIAVLLTIRANVFNFPVGAVACVLTFVYFWQIGLFAEASLQIFYLVLLLYGWWNWRRPQAQTAEISAKPELPVRFAPPNVLALGLLGAAVLGAVIGWALDRWTPSQLPYWDAEVAAFSILGQAFVARKWVENWPIWVGANVISVGLMWEKQAFLYSALYVFFIVLALLGWHEWTRKAAR